MLFKIIFILFLIVFAGIILGILYGLFFLKKEDASCITKFHQRTGGKLESPVAGVKTLLIDRPNGEHYIIYGPRSAPGYTSTTHLFSFRMRPRSAPTVPAFFLVRKIGFSKVSIQGFHKQMVSVLAHGNQYDVFAEPSPTSDSTDRLQPLCRLLQAEMQRLDKEIHIIDLSLRAGAYSVTVKETIDSAERVEEMLAAFSNLFDAISQTAVSR
jgi:hypothetical protein